MTTVKKRAASPAVESTLVPTSQRHRPHPSSPLADVYAADSAPLTQAASSTDLLERLVERVQRAERPAVLSTDAAVVREATRSLVRRWRPGADADLLLAASEDLPADGRADHDASATVVLDTPRLQRVLELCSGHAEVQMAKAAGTAESSSSSTGGSLYELVHGLRESTAGVGLCDRHAALLALEALLSAHVEGSRVKPLALRLLLEGCAAAADPRSVSALMVMARAEAVENCTLNIVSALVWSEQLAGPAVLEWTGRCLGSSTEMPIAPASAGPSSRDAAAPGSSVGRGEPGAGCADVLPGCDTGTEALSSVDGAPASEPSPTDVERLAPLLTWLEVEAAAESDASTSEEELTVTPTTNPADATAFGPAHMPLWREVRVRPTEWEPCGLQPTLNLRLSGGEAVVVLDGLIDEAVRAELLRLLRDSAAEPQPTPAPSATAAHSGGGNAAPGEAPRACGARTPEGSSAAAGADEPPCSLWERTTCDGAGLPLSWGMRPRWLRRLERRPPGSVLEVHARLCKLYPEYLIAHMPEITDEGCGQGRGDSARQPSGSKRYSCTSFVANAAVYGNCFQWHCDADPCSVPLRSEWARRFGLYTNGERGQPLFVSLLIYLDPAWRREWDAETLFLDEDLGAGVFVQPRPGRAVLMHQDALHRVSTPSMVARRPRYSLVWKLLFVPRHGRDNASQESISRPEWGPPACLCAARMAEPTATT